MKTFVILGLSIRSGWQSFTHWQPSGTPATWEHSSKGLASRCGAVMYDKGAWQLQARWCRGCSEYSGKAFNCCFGKRGQFPFSYRAPEPVKSSLHDVSQCQKNILKTLCNVKGKCASCWVTVIPSFCMNVPFLSEKAMLTF